MEKQGDRLQAGRCNPHAYEVAIRECGALCGARGTSVPIPAHTKEVEGLSTLSIPQKPARPSPNRPVSITQTNLEHSAPQLISI